MPFSRLHREAIGRETMRHGTMHRSVRLFPLLCTYTRTLFTSRCLRNGRISRYFYRFSTRPLKLNRSRTPSNYAESRFTAACISNTFAKVRQTMADGNVFQNIFHFSRYYFSYVFFLPTITKARPLKL